MPLAPWIGCLRFSHLDCNDLHVLLLQMEKALANLALKSEESPSKQKPTPPEEPKAVPTTSGALKGVSQSLLERVSTQICIVTSSCGGGGVLSPLTLTLSRAPRLQKMCCGRKPGKFPDDEARWKCRVRADLCTSGHFFSW